MRVVPLVYGYSGGKQDLRIDNQAQLHELAAAAVEDLGRVGGLFRRPFADLPHLVDGRQIAQEEHGVEVGRVAHLTVVDDDAGAAAGG
jgi:hypothetical protein